MWEFIKNGGPFMVLLLITSVAAVAMIIERGVALRWRRVVPPALLDALERARGRADLAALDGACQAQPSTLGRLLQVAAQNLDRPRAEVADILQTRARREVARLERGLVIIEVIVGISPLLGLVGTIHGLITLFGGLGKIGLGDNAELARGIAIALNTTLMGLLIAIPSLIAWSYFSKKVETLTVELETVCAEFLDRFHPRAGEGALDRAEALMER